MYKVLIVDDEKYVISLIEKLIDWEKLGINVVGSAGDGMKGVELVEELKPDILIADVKMPGFDGISLVKRVREIDRDIKFIIISGHKKFEYAKSVMKYNVEDYILKPIDKEELEDECGEMDADELMMTALDAGAEDFNEEEDSFEILTAPDDFSAVREALEKAGIPMVEAQVAMVPQTYVDLTDEKDVKNLQRTLDLLDEDDDVTDVWTNWNE